MRSNGLACSMFAPMFESNGTPYERLVEWLERRTDRQRNDDDDDELHEQTNEQSRSIGRPAGRFNVFLFGRCALKVRVK